MGDGKDKKGFAGLDSMVSEVDVPKHVPEPAEPMRAEPRPAYAAPPSPAGGSWKWWAVGIGVVFLVIWAGGSSEKSTTTPSLNPSYTSPTYSDPAPGYVYVPLAPESSPDSALNEEQMPPVGSGLSFNRAQIRYCLSEDIRISAWQEKINHYSESSVDAFNIAVNNYNMRCSSFRYRSGMLESVRAEVEANRYVLQLEGTRSALLNP